MLESTTGITDDRGNGREDNCCFRNISAVYNKKPVALFFGAMSGIMFTASNFMVQVVIGLTTPTGRRMSTLQIVMVRCMIQLIFTIPVLIVLKAPILRAFRDLVYLIPMGVSGYVNIVLIYMSLEKIPLSDSLLITFTSPFFCAIFSYVFLREKVHWIDVICGVISFIGVCVVARPSEIFGEDPTAEKQTLFQTKKLTSVEKEAVYLIGVLFGLLGAIFLAMYFVLIRVCSIIVEMNPMVSIFYPSLLGSIFSPIIQHMKKEKFVVPDSFTVAISLLSVGFYSTIALCFMTIALKRENATIINLIRNLDIVYAFVFQYAVFNIYPTVWNVSGGLIIILATGGMVLKQWWNWRRCPKDETDENINES